MSDNERIERAREVEEFFNEIRKRIDDFTFDQIYMIERGLLSGLPLELIKFSARPEFDAIQMEGIYLSYRNGFSLEQLQRCITSQLNRNQWKEIILWAKHDLDFERFVEELGRDLLPKISRHLIGEVREDLVSGLSWERIKEFIQLCKEKNCLNDDGKIKAINKGILAGLTKEEIDAHIKSEHDSEQVEQIIEELIKKKESEVYKNEEVAVFIKSLERSGKFNEEKLREIRLGLANGFTVDQVRLYADERLYSWYMRKIRLCLQAGYSKEQIRFFIDLLIKESSDYFVDEVSLWLKDSLPLWFLDYLLQHPTYVDSTDSFWLNYWRRKLRKLPKDQIDDYCKKFQSFIMVCKQCQLDNVDIINILRQFPGDQFEICFQRLSHPKVYSLVKECRKAGFDHWETSHIVLGYLYGLSKKQIGQYKRRMHSISAISDIGLAQLEGFTQEEIKFLTNFDFLQREVVKLGFELGLSLKQVKKFAKPEYDTFYMEELFLGYLWGLPEKLIKFYMDKKLQFENRDKTPTSYFGRDYFHPQTIFRIALLKGLTIPEIEFALQKFLPQKGSLKLTLEEFAKDKKARAKLRSFINLNTKLKELKEDWKRNISETKGEKKRFTL